MTRRYEPIDRFDAPFEEGTMKDSKWNYSDTQAALNPAPEVKP